MIEIREGDREAGFAVPFEIYDRSSPYVSPMWSDFDRLLDPARNPLCGDGRGRLVLYTAHRGGRPVGRIAASVHDASNRRHGTHRAQFGFLDCGDDADVSTALLGAAEAWAEGNGATELLGNFNLTAMQMAGVVTEGFGAPPYTDMMWTPPHLPRLLERAGYAPTFPMSTFETDLSALDPSVLLGPKQRAILDDPDFAFLPITRKTFRDRMEDARILLNDGFGANPMFMPVTAQEYSFQAGEMMWVMDRRLSVVAYHRGRPAGVVVCIPDLNPLLRATGSRLSWTTPYHYLRYRMARSRAVIIYYSVASEQQNRGLNGAMLHRLATQAKAAGYRSLGITWIADVNAASLRQMERLGARRLHRLHLYSKRLGDGGQT
ncbi:MAG: GNAT family N-acetyltransferase [Rhizobiaceae bacterium]|nr:GNAT family N-acetyltransferase [Rhizobiaceae bacterium]